MHVETICPGCQRKLRVGSEHAGKQARCPMCNAVYSVPSIEAIQPADPSDQWRLQTPEGQEYGPASRVVLEGWVAEGRVSDDCKLLCEADGIWRTAGDVYSVLRPVQVAVEVKPWPDVPTDSDPSNDSSSSIAPTFRGHVTNTHRGGMILALGILSWAIGCPVFGILAWVMGSNDLSEMRQGTMDPQGQSLTEAGRMIGMIHSILVITVLFIGVLVLLVLKII
jgi:hypothetical protein